MWIFYISITFPGLQSQKTSSTTSSPSLSEGGDNEESFGAVFMRGFSRIKDDARMQWDAFSKNVEQFKELRMPSSQKNILPQDNPVETSAP